MDIKDMILVVKEILNGQKIPCRATADGAEVLFKDGKDTIEINPCNPQGKALIGKIVLLNVDNMGQVGELWSEANQKWQFDPTYDQFFANFTGLTMLPNQSAGRKRMFLYYNWESFEDMKIDLANPDTFKGIMDQLRILSEYVLKEDKV